MRVFLFLFVWRTIYSYFYIPNIVSLSFREFVSFKKENSEIQEREKKNLPQLQ